MPVDHPTTRRAVAYYCMSTDDQEDSIAQRRGWASRACAREGLALAVEFEDAGVSGAKTDQRQGLQRMLRAHEDAANEGRGFDVLVCWDLDRLSRADSFRTYAVMARLMDAGVTRSAKRHG